MMQKRLNVNLGPQNEDDDDFKIHDADEVVPENKLDDDDDDEDSGSKKKKPKKKIKKAEKTEDDVDHNEKSDEGIEAI